MVLVFDDKDHHVATQKVVMGEGDRTPISIPFKKDYVLTTDNHYRVVAFTYNTKNPEDFDGLNLDPSQTNDNPEIAILSDKEFFYYNGDAPIDPHPTNPDTRQLISIKFVPQTVKVAITIDGRGLNAKVLKMSGRFSDFSIRNTGTMNLKLNQVSRSTVDNVNFPYDFSVTGEGDTLSVARYVYMDESDGTQTLNNLSVTLTELVVQRDGEPATTVLSTPATKAKVYSFGSLSLKKGKFYNGRIHLLTGFEIDGIVWAYGNLYYDKADVGNEFKIRKSPDEGKFASTDYWMFSSSLSGDSFKILSDSTKKIIGSGYNYTYTSVGLNPCAKVYPYNTWRVPSEAEAKKFLSNTQSELDFRFVKPDSGTRYVEFKKTGTTSPVIRFYAHSYYENEKLITEGFMGLFWLKDNVGSLQKSLVYTIVDDFVEWQQAGGTGVKKGSNTDAITGYGTALFDPKMNIRCVRDLRN